MSADPIRVLYLEDDRLDRKLVRETLQSSEIAFKLRTATTWKEFSRELSRREFEIILSDFEVMNFTGLQVLDAVRDQNPNVPVVIITRRGSERIAAEVIKHGAAEYRSKSLPEIRQLPQIIQNVLKSQALQIKHQPHQVYETGNKSQERYRLLFNNAEIFISIYDYEGTCLLMNKKTAELFDGKPADFQGKSFLELHPVMGEEYLRRIQTTIDKAKTREYEDRVQFPTGPRWLLSIVHPLTDHAGEITSAQIISQDITARKEMEEALASSEQRYRSIVEDQTEFICRFTPDEKLTFVNTAYSREAGTSKDELLGTSFMDFIPEEDRAFVREQYQSLSPESPTISYAHRVLSAEGEVKWQWWTDRAIFNADGEIIEYQSVGKDITKEIQFQRELEASEKKYRSLFESIRDAILVTNTEREIIDCNQAFEELFGYTLPDLKGKLTKYIYKHEEEFRQLGEKLQDHPQDQNFFFTISYQKKSGEVFPGETNVFFLKDQTGMVTGFVGLIRDISDRLQTEQALQESADMLQRSQEIAQIGSYIWDLRDDSLQWSPNMYEIHGLDKEQFAENLTDVSREVIHPEDQAYVQEQIQTMLDNRQVHDMTFRIIRRDGEIRHIRSTGEFEFGEDGTPAKAIGVHQDITSQIQIENQLRESERRYRSLFEHVPIGLYRTTPEGFITDANQALLDILGYPAKDAILGLNASELYVNSRDEKRWESEMRENNTVQGFEAPFYRQDGTIIWVKDNVRKILDQTGQLIAYQGSLEDITEERKAKALEKEQRQMAEALQDTALALSSALEFEKVLDQIFANIGKVVSSPSVNLMLVEDERVSIVRHQGYTEQEQKNWETLDMRIAERPNLLRMMSTKQPVLIPDTHHSPYWKVVPGGEWIRSYAAAPILDEGSDVIGFLNLDHPDPEFFTHKDLQRLAAFSQQISIALKNAQAQEELKQRGEQLRNLAARLSETEEKERRRLAKELHDQIGQTLAVLNFNLNMIQDMLETSSQEKIAAHLQKSISMVEEITGGIRGIMNDLRPSVLDDYGLQAALHWFADRYEGRTGIETRVKGQPLEPRLPARIENALFRITQEALANVTQHAQASRVQIELMDTPQTVTLSIRDNGIGFEKPLTAPEEPGETGWGLINMQERVEMLKGTFEIKAQSDQGTTIQVQIPRG